MADTDLKIIEKAVMDVVLSREGRRRYNKGDPLTLDPSDLRDIVRLTMVKCATPPLCNTAPDSSALHLFMKASYQCCTSIDARGYQWCEAYLDQARATALASRSAVAEQAHARAEAAGFTTRYDAGKHVFTGGIEQIERLLAFHPAEKDECRIPLVSIDSLISVAAEIAAREKKHQAAAAETEVLAGAVWNAPTTASQVDPRQAAPSGRWSEELPIDAGHYWHWNGRCESRPVLLSGTYSHGVQQLVGAGGEPLAMLGGYWWRVHQPPTSSAMTPVLTLQEGNQERYQ